MYTCNDFDMEDTKEVESCNFWDFAMDPENGIMDGITKTEEC